MQNTKTKTIGIWGFYFAENFGDDLMALQISQIVKNLGATPLVFELSPILGARYGIDTTNEICDFCQRSEMILIGGGNLLAQKYTWPDGPFLKKISELTMGAEHWNKPIHAISIGGDGAILPVYPYVVERLLSSKVFRTACVRISADKNDLEKRKVTAFYKPDILWSSAHFFGITKKTDGDKYYGIHFLKNPNWVREGINKFRERLVKKAPERKLCFVSAFLHDPTSGDFLPDNPESSESIFRGGDPIEVMKCISGLECVASQRLHVGVIAMSMKIPFFSVLAHPKVRAELSQIGWGWISEFDGLKPRRFFGARWLATKLTAELTQEKIAQNRKLILDYHDPAELGKAYEAHISMLIGTPDLKQL
jgi:hypothetical protein